MKNRYSKVDQLNLRQQIEYWQKAAPGDYFKFRPKTVDYRNGASSTAMTCDDVNNDDEYDDEVIIDHDTPGESLLFCYQTEWQKTLLRTYGTEICFLDATYRTTRYSLPLFFLVVRANSGYIVVGTFVIENETTNNIAEALKQFQSWNTDWHPQYFLTDFSDAEISAIERTFPGNYSNIIITICECNCRLKL